MSPAAHVLKILHTVFIRCPARSMTRPIIIEVDFGYLGLVAFFPQVSPLISPPTATRFNPVELPLHFSQFHSQHNLVGFLR